MDYQYKSKYLKYKYKYSNLKSKLIQQGGNNYNIDLTSNEPFQLNKLNNSDILIVKYDNTGNTIHFNVEKPKSNEYKLKYKFNPALDANLDIGLTINTDDIISKLTFIRKIVSSNNSNIPDFNKLYNIYICLSKKLGSNKLILEDDARYFNNKQDGYSSKAFRVFNHNNSIYMKTKELGFEPDFNFFNSKYKEKFYYMNDGEYNINKYNEDIELLSSITFGELVNYFKYLLTTPRYKNSAGLNFDFEKTKFDSDSKNNIFLSMNFGEYLRTISKDQNLFKYINTLISMLNTDYSNIKDYKLNENLIEIINRFNRYNKATEKLISNNFTCLLSKNDEKLILKPIDLMQFVTNFRSNLTQSDFYFEYNKNFPSQTIENIVFILNNICEQLYEYIKKPLNTSGTITIASYSTGLGFIEAYFANWLKYTGKCEECNIVFADTNSDTLSNLSKYNIFDNIIDAYEPSILLDFNTLITKGILEPIKKRYSIYKIDLFLAFNPQNYLCTNIKNCQEIKSYLTFLLIIGIIIKNSFCVLKITDFLEWTKEVNMLWIFWFSSLFENSVGIKNIKKLIINNSSEYYKDIQPKFNYIDIKYTISRLYDIQIIFNLTPVDVDIDVDIDNNKRIIFMNYP
jgi:hypothetical protein